MCMLPNFQGKNCLPYSRIHHEISTLQMAAQVQMYRKFVGISFLNSVLKFLYKAPGPHVIRNSMMTSSIERNYFAESISTPQIATSWYTKFRGLGIEFLEIFRQP